ncbi:mitochondrial large subunit ribosomal protein-domain-containing protein [Lipomyces japonicus]|uniref:mitochondrial 54S ribosomal protein mL49 n=1 Tax=Lipomyces japonicus TaxID=56871 RepID=UPI0034CF2D7A
MLFSRLSAEVSRLSGTVLRAQRCRYNSTIAAVKSSEQQQSSTVKFEDLIPQTKFTQGQQEHEKSINLINQFYWIHRTVHGELPIYNIQKHGGSRLLTLIRGIKGDASLLRKDLIHAFKIHSSKVTLNKTNNTILVNGHRAQELRSLLEKHF